MEAQAGVWGLCSLDKATVFMVMEVVQCGQQSRLLQDKVKYAVSEREDGVTDMAIIKG